MHFLKQFKEIEVSAVRLSLSEWYLNFTNIKKYTYKNWRFQNFLRATCTRCSARADIFVTATILWFAAKTFCIDGQVKMMNTAWIGRPFLRSRHRGRRDAWREASLNPINILFFIFFFCHDFQWYRWSTSPRSPNGLYWHHEE